MSAGTAAPISAMRPIDESAVTGMIPGTTGVEMPRAARSSTSPRYSSDPEEELGDREVGQAQLLGQAVAVGPQVGRSGMAGRVGRHPDREPADGPGQLDQLDGVSPARLRWRRDRSADRRRGP